MSENYVQAYLTKGLPDENGNYFTPIFVPVDVEVSMPITKVVPDESLGNKGLKFDWITKKWALSADDPTVKQIEALENKLTQANKLLAQSGLQTAKLQSQVNTMVNATSTAPIVDQQDSSVTSSAAEATSTVTSEAGSTESATPTSAQGGDQ